MLELTKREFFTIEIVKALQTNAGRNGYHPGTDIRLIQEAINTADMVIELLERQSCDQQN